MRSNALVEVGFDSIMQVSLDLGEYPLAMRPVDMQVGVDVVEIPIDHRLVKHPHPPEGSP
ncbi:MAG: hypothetical protein JWM47_196 [Acidimicrobiales bacterium]|nr:hypothetical protein [Acidimicrobiales bacterium]